MLKKSPFSCLKRSPLKKTPFKKKKNTADELHEKLVAIEKMRTFFLHIWSTRPHYCTICGAGLGSEPLSYHFDHLIEKQSHPELKYEAHNISLLCLSCHDCKSRGIIPASYAMIIEYTKKLFNVE